MKEKFLIIKQNIYKYAKDINLFNVIFDVYLILCMFEVIFTGSQFFVNEYDGLKDTTVKLGIIIVILFFIFKKVRYKKDYLILLLMLISGILSLVLTKYTPVPGTYYKSFTRALMVITLYVLNDKKDYKFIFLTFLFIIFIVDIKSLLMLDFIPSSFRELRFSGYWNNYDILGTMNAYSIILIFFFRKKFKLTKVISFVLIALNMFMVYLSACRTAIVIIIAVLVAYVFKKHKKIFLRTIIVTSILLSIVSIAFNKTLFSNSIYPEDYTKTETIINNKSSGRYEIQKQAIYIAANSPFLGVGTHNIMNSANLYSEKNDGYIDLIRFHSTHNFVVDSLLETGLIGTSLYMYFIVKKCKLMYKNLENNDLWIYYALIIAGLVDSMLDRHICFYMSISGYFFWMSLNKIEQELLKSNKEKINDEC